MGNDVKMNKGWPDEILQVERIGTDAGCYYLSNIVELEQSGRDECRFTGLTSDDAIDNALNAIRAKGVPSDTERLSYLKAQESRITNKLDSLRLDVIDTAERLAAIQEEIAKERKVPSTPLLKATELLEEEKMLKEAAAWLDPETERGFQRVAFRLYKDRDGDGDPDIIASWHR